MNIKKNRGKGYFIFMLLAFMASLFLNDKIMFLSGIYYVFFIISTVYLADFFYLFALDKKMLKTIYLSRGNCFFNVAFIAIGGAMLILTTINVYQITAIVFSLIFISSVVLYCFNK